MPKKNALATLLVVIVFCCSLAAQKSGGSGGSRPAPRTPPIVSNAGSGVENITVRPPEVFRASDEKRVTFSTEAILIQVPVTVVDKNGAHIPNLGIDDFRVLENGKQQRLAGCEEMVAEATKPVSTKENASPLRPKEGLNGASEEYRNLVAVGQQRGVIVIVLDTVNTPLFDQQYARKAAIKYLAQHVSSDQPVALMAITSHGLRVLHGLTADPAKLVEALKMVSGELTYSDIDGTAARIAEWTGNSTVNGDLPNRNWFATNDRPLKLDSSSLVDVSRMDAMIARNNQAVTVETTMRAFLGIAWATSGIPGRKSVLWATGGFPFALDQEDALPSRELAPLYERTMAALNQAQISVYPIDARGLLNYSPMSDPKFNGSTNFGLAASTRSRTVYFDAGLGTLDTFARMTGGKMFAGSNDLEGAFRRAATEASSYYLLSYYLDKKNRMPGWRKLRVEVSKRDATVRTRSGFLVTNATFNPETVGGLDLQYALALPMDATGLPLSLEWGATNVAGDKSKVPFTLVLPGESVVSDHYEFHIAAVAYSEGKVAATLSQKSKGTVPATALAKVHSQGMAYQGTLDLSPGEYEVRMVVRDDLTGKLGTLSVPLAVK